MKEQLNNDMYIICETYEMRESNINEETVLKRLKLMTVEIASESAKTLPSSFPTFLISSPHLT